ncbi:tRNA lysidine(34) synthetase TilS [Paracoccus sp. DMF-8]|uniref:tRNA lysidine(34) synthetase n=1 Tax=Paracoccus sp. DMF-8 TaxID=3019445 RepID=UPI0023E87B57|nr:tRNA lysidine(34) synthetase TilS [Paracoccus sp. DMF-8]MDF3607175.1 tRNA lysidine(34) synthetase TilS [Paracoccus sp. DMF-8]
MLGHTLDDQAETLLMRLGRGAGVDGLSGMAASRLAFGTVWLRLMLGLSRQELRDWLREQGLRWIDDPSNQNLDYERVRMRKALEALDIPAASLGQDGGQSGDGARCAAGVRRPCDGKHRDGSGADFLQLSDFTGAPEEIRRRILVTGLRWMTGSDYPARRDEVLHAMVAVGAGGRTTLEGVILERRASRLRMIPRTRRRRAGARRHRRCRWRRDLGQPLAPRRADNRGRRCAFWAMMR